MKRQIYVDNAATTRLSRAAAEAMRPYLDGLFGNPSSAHTAGMKAAQALKRARETLAGLLGCSPKGIYFTSGGSESDNQALISAAAWGAEHGRRHLIASAFEHPAVLRTLEALRNRGFETEMIPVSRGGIVDPGRVASSIRDGTCLVSVMAANNEIGTVQPIAEIGRICHERHVLFHTDAVQAAGHIPLNIRGMKVDLLSLSAHKFHGPKGAGVLYAGENVPLVPLIRGGGQERGLRAGTQNVPAIAGMAAALREACGKMEADASHTAALRDRLTDGLESIPGAVPVGDRDHRLPGIVNFCFRGVEAEPLLLLLDEEGICASSGSACAAGALEPSHVLLALGLPKALARGELRFSLDAGNTEEEIDTVIRATASAVTRLRRYAGKKAL